MPRTPLFRKVSQLVAQSPPLSGLTRREFLWGALGVAAGLPRLAKPISTGDPPLVIVGAGVAGLTLAYRLMQKGVDCAIYEASFRAGGRMQSKQAFNAEGMYIDLGAELIDTGHADLISLCKELNVELLDLTTGAGGMIGTLFLSHGSARTEAQFIEAFLPFAAILAADINKLSPGGMLTIPTYKKPLGPEVIALDRTSLAAYLYACRGHVDRWVLEMVEQAYVGEFGREAAEQSAINLLTLISPETQQGLKMYGPSDESRRIRGGSERLPEALGGAIASRVPLHFGHRLIAVRRHGLRLELVFSTSGGTLTLRAPRVAIAIPFSVLREVEGLPELDLSPTKKLSIRTLGYGTNAKHMLGFHYRFWRAGSANLPPATGEVFSDAGTQEFWDTSRAQQGSSGILTSYLGGQAGVSISPHLVENTLSELSRIYPGAADAFDGHHALKPWALSPYQKGSYTCPMPGQYTSIIGVEGEPELGGRLLFLGEHTSPDYQGFMNGAVESANRLAEELTRELPVRHARFSPVR